MGIKWFVLLVTLSAAQAAHYVGLFHSHIQEDARHAFSEANALQRHSGDVFTLTSSDHLAFAESNKHIVRHVAHNDVVRAHAAPCAADATNDWGLDFMDGRLDSVFAPAACSRGGHVFIIDSGIWPNPVFTLGLGTCTLQDCALSWRTNEGHGTMCGSMASGTAPRATLHDVRALNGQGVGNTLSTTLAMAWVLKTVTASNATLRPAVVSMSFSGPQNSLTDELIKDLVTNNILVVAAAGNDGLDACRFSPSGSPDAFVVGAIDIHALIPSFSNTGSCVDTYAPGVDVLAMKPYGLYETVSGTSFATPLVAGYAATLWAASSHFTLQDTKTSVMQSLPHSLQSQPAPPPPDERPSQAPSQSVMYGILGGVGGFVLLAALVACLMCSPTKIPIQRRANMSAQVRV
jgi:subtilisin family serine protease